MQKITTISHLVETCEAGNHEFVVALNYGLKSSKNIYHNNGVFYIYHDVDGSEESVTDINDSIVGEALSEGALYVY